VDSTGPADSARDLLAAERASTEARLAALERDFDGIVEASASAATDDEHDPEGGTTAFERQHVAALISQARDQLAGIAQAIERLDAGSYGRCEQCGRAIAAERLAARPAASRCISCATG
jgi:DnaK suppressor protein